jgi:hypothetical protein
MLNIQVTGGQQMIIVQAHMAEVLDIKYFPDTMQLFTSSQGRVMQST